MLLKDLCEKVIDNRGKTPPLVFKGKPLIEAQCFSTKEFVCSNDAIKFLDNNIYNSLRSGLCKENDILVVSRLDRFARNTVEGIKVVEELFKRKISIHILNVGLLEDTPMGRFFLTTMLAVAELERNMIIERTQNGKELARQNPNFKDGRPKKYTEEELENAIRLLEIFSYSEVVRQTGISKSTLVRAMKIKRDNQYFKL